MAVMPKAAKSAAPELGPTSMLITPPSAVLLSLAAVESANKVRRPLTAAAVTPVMAALLMAVANPATVSAVAPAPTVTKLLLINMLAPLVRLDGDSVPCTVGHEIFQASEPICTHWLEEFL